MKYPNGYKEFQASADTPSTVLSGRRMFCGRSAESGSLPLNPRHNLKINAALDFDPDGAHDPIEAIYALNIGDFAADGFFSDDDAMREKIHPYSDHDPDKLEAQLEELIRIYAIDKTLAVLGLDPQKGFLIYDSLAATLARLFQMDACHLFQMATRESGERYLGLTGTSLSLERDRRWEINLAADDDDFLGRVCRSGDTVHYGRVSELPGWKPLEKLERLGEKSAQSILVAPLREGSRTMGVLLLESAQAIDFPPEMLRLARITARLFVTGMRLQTLLTKAKDPSDGRQGHREALFSLRAQITESIADLSACQQEFLETLSAAVDARCHFTRGHSRKTAELARRIAEALELNEKTIDLIWLAALLGSLGRVEIPTEILRKKESLTPAEWDCLRQHPNVGVNLLVKIHFLSEVLPYVACQHERWDGSGGPEGLKGRSIPLGARILAVAGVYTAMTQDRPYREKAMSHQEALDTLQKEAGARWDPLVVETLAGLPPED